MNIQPTVSGSVPVGTPVTKPQRTADKPLPQAEVTEVKSKQAENKPSDAQSTLTAKEAVKRVAEFVSQTTSEITFSIDAASGVDVVKIIDRASNEVIRQMPSEEMIAIAQALDKLQGLFVRDKV